LEVAEHIPPVFTDVNGNNAEEAVRLIERWGFKADLEASQALREQASFPWFKNGNVIVYRLQSSENTHINQQTLMLAG
jgi:hypothetical protein